MDLHRLHHAEWFGGDGASRAVAIDELLEQLGDEWQFEALTRVNELTVATFLHRSDVRFVLVPGGRFVEGWTEDEQRRLDAACEAADHDWHGGGTPPPLSFPPRERVVRPFLLAMWPLTPWQLSELLGRTDLLESLSYGAVHPTALPLLRSALEARGYRFPTSTESEFAARAGTRALFPDGADELPRTPQLAPNPLGLMQCGEPDEVCLDDERWSSRGGAANCFPWQGPNWMVALSAWRRPVAPHPFASVRPAVALQGDWSDARATLWEQPAPWQRGHRITPRDVTVPPHVPEHLHDAAWLENTDLDLRALLHATPEVARRLTRRLGTVLLLRDDDELAKVFDFVEAHEVSGRAQLAGWLVTELQHAELSDEWEDALRRLAADEDPGVRGAAQWWLEDPPARDEHPTVLLCAAMRAGSPEWLREHPEPLVSTMAGQAPERALAWLLPPDDFPFSVEAWFTALLRQAPRPLAALEQRVTAPCASEDAATLRDLAAKELLRRTFRVRTPPPQLDGEQRRVVELLRRHDVRVPWFEHGLPDV